MTITATIKDAEDKLKALNLPEIVFNVAKTKQQSFAKLSKLIRKHPGFVYQRLQRFSMTTFG